MISDKLRKRKPYAIPVQFVPYKSIGDFRLHDPEVKLEKAMRNAKMTVVSEQYGNHVAFTI